MPRSFSSIVALIAVFLVNLGVCALARAQKSAPICNGESEAQQTASLDTYINSVMVVHGQYAFAHGLKADLQKKAKDFLGQRLLDQRTELCAARLQLAENIRNSGRSGCTQVADFLGPYMQKAANVYSANKNGIQVLHDESVKALKKKLFEIASGSTIGIEGISYQGQPLTSAPRELKYEWLKIVAGQLGAEVHRAWGVLSPEKNPLVRANAEFAREAVAAKRESDAVKKNGVACP
jgi:hypothetical protein